MSIYETIGVCWVILSTAVFTVAFFYLAIKCGRHIVEEARLSDELRNEIDKHRFRRLDAALDSLPVERPHGFDNWN